MDAPADGYTLLLDSIGLHATYSIYPKLAYNPGTDLKVVTVLAEMPHVVVATPTLAATDLKQLVADARKNPNTINFGSAGVGSSVHMIGELFKLTAEAPITHVPYKGSSAALNDLMGGQIQLMFENPPTTLSQIRAGKLKALALLGESLVDLHGQHQSIQLLDASVQRDLLDAFADAVPLTRAVATAWAELQALKGEADALSSRRDQAQRRADWLRHVIAEIDHAQPRPDEDETLDRELTRLGHAGTLGEHARQLRDALDGDEGSARAAIARAERSLNVLERLDDAVGVWRELLDAVYAQLDELARLADGYGNDLAEDPSRLDALERRRDLLYRLKQKHGATLEAVVATREAAQAELDLLDTAALDLRTLATRITAGERALMSIAAELSTVRGRAAEQLARETNRLLPRLGLTGGELSVSLEPLRDVGAHGGEQVILMVRLNRGMASAPLARVASGGELSRLMLALKVVLARHDAVPTLIFDEVDQGIGGEVGAQVGEALGQVAARHQVLVITHLPQIAARADHHLRVAKATKGGIATSDVALLLGEDRVLELARMLGSAEDDAARRLAQSLLRGAATA